MFSQNDEERVILEFFSSLKGKFLDIGAHNGIDLSNTRALAMLGWKGVCVEPSPIAFHQLLNLYERNGSVKLVNCAVDKESKLKEFLDNNGGYVSTLLRSHQEMMSSKFGSCYRGMYLKTITIQEILDTFGYDFDFINLDIEGMSNTILELIPFNRLTKLSLLCVEHDNLSDDISKTVGKYGFYKIHTTRENIILCRQ